jgi:hypothetical protein
MHWLIQYLNCATSQVAGLVPDEVIEIFHWHNSSTYTLTLESSQPLTEISTRAISWRGKDGQCVGLTTFPLLCADCPEIQRASTSWSIKDLSSDSFSFTVSVRWTLNNTFLKINYVNKPSSSSLTGVTTHCGFLPSQWFSSIPPFPYTTFSTPYSHYLYIFFDVLNPSFSWSSSVSPTCWCPL